MATTTTTRTTKKTTKAAPKKAPAAKRTTATKPAAPKKTARRTTAPKAPAVKADVTAPPAPDAATSAEGRLVSFLRSSLGTIEDATLSVGGNALGSIPGLPKGATDKMKSAHSSVIRGTSDRIESVTVGSATAVGKSLQAMVSPIRKLFR
jgi:hypothetical protein